jgi:hypothetical protein
LYDNHTEERTQTFRAGHTHSSLLLGPGAGHALLAVIWVGALAGVALARRTERAGVRLA